MDVDVARVESCNLLRWNACRTTCVQCQYLAVSGLPYSAFPADSTSRNFHPSFLCRELLSRSFMSRSFSVPVTDAQMRCENFAADELRDLVTSTFDLLMALPTPILKAYI